MSQESSPQRAAFGEKSDTTLWISLAVGMALLGGLALAQWSSSISAAEASADKAADAAPAKRSVGAVYQCDGKVSFTPCS